MDEKHMELMLNDWKLLNADLGKMREDQMRALLNYEVSTRKRASYIERIHQRFTKARMKRERAELLAGGVL